MGGSEALAGSRLQLRAPECYRQKYVMTRWIIAAAVIALWVLPARAKDSEQERATLKGLERVRVVVYVEGTAAGVEASTLQKNVEQAVRRAGLRVITAAQRESDPDAGLLVVNVASVENTLAGSERRVGYAYRTDLNLWQVAMLLRAEWIRSYSATWQAPGRLGTCASDALAAEIEKSVDAQLNLFLAAYHAANAR